MLKKIFKTLLAMVLLVLLVVGGYLLYMEFKFYRIEDNVELEIANEVNAQLESGNTYNAITYNTGFGAYSPEFSFFMDAGIMNDGTETQGEYGKGISREVVQKNTDGILGVLNQYMSDFIFLQEVDVKADRSYHINQVEIYERGMSDYEAVFANNFHAPFLFYPLHDPHGAVEAGLLTFSKYDIVSASRKSLPIDMSFPAKHLDLDRCFSVSRCPVNTGKDLLVINCHLSAYDEGGTIRKEQFKRVNEFISEEYEKGNYIIMGGDYNQALCDTVESFKSDQMIPEWVSEMNIDDIAEGFTMVEAKNIFEIPTCRNADMPYVKNVNYTCVIDGFMVSDNIEAEAENIDTEFAFSDHNPVLITFTLL